MASNDVLAIRKTTDYSQCSLCQKGSVRDAQIRKPYVRKQDHGSYAEIEKFITDITAKNEPLPFGLNEDCLNDGSGIKETLLKNKAFFHHSCRESLRRTSTLATSSVQSNKRSVEEEPAFSPKKLRKDFTATLNNEDPRTWERVAHFLGSALVE